jgi:dTDP-4-amino-4,6-dideoxygalactose transaminase
MLYERHGAGPDRSTFADIRLDTPNMSARMDNLRAALLRPQLRTIDGSIEAWNARHDYLAGRLASCPAIRMPARPDAEEYVGSSIQFLVPGIAAAGAREIVERLSAAGVELKWFGEDQPVAFTSNHHSWRFAGPQSLPRTDAVLSGLFDMRLPLTFSLDDCALLAGHIIAAVSALAPGCDA